VKLFDLMKEASEKRPQLLSLKPCARVVVASGRKVLVKPLNLKRALTVLALLTQVLENVGWSELSKKSLLQVLLEATTVGQGELVDILSILTGEPSETILSEFTPADTVNVLLTAWKQEAEGVDPEKLRRLTGAEDNAKAH